MVNIRVRNNFKYRESGSQIKERMRERENGKEEIKANSEEEIKNRSDR